MRTVTYIRLFSDQNGDTRFEDVKVPVNDNGTVGFLSGNINVKELQFRVNEADYDWDFHNAPARQFIVLLDGEIEITTSLGETRKFSGGDVLLVEDTDGKGHKTRNIKRQIRKSIFIKL